VIGPRAHDSVIVESPLPPTLPVLPQMAAPPPYTTEPKEQPAFEQAQPVYREGDKSTALMTGLGVALSGNLAAGAFVAADMMQDRYLVPPQGAPAGGRFIKEDYFGMWTLFICVCGFPFIALCPVDDRTIYIDPSGKRWVCTEEVPA
jgi:hypothetical protein